MSLERIITEQQQKIDDLTEGNKKLIERSARIFKQNEDLFQAFARFLDADLPKDVDNIEGTNVFKHYQHCRQEARIQMMDAGYCLRCYNFICECDDYD